MSKIKKSGSPLIFAIVGVVLSVSNFLIYTFLARVIFQSNDLLWLVSGLAYLLTAILAYILHSKITWKGRKPTKMGILGFFFWNLISAVAISPFFTWIFGFLGGFYEFIFGITSSLGLAFDYAFIESTMIFCLTTAVTMVLNFFFYDRLVFGDLMTKIFKKRH